MNGTNNYNFAGTKNNVTSSTTAYPSYSTCGSRLPCGLCLITNQRCPMMACGPNITWTSGDGLYQPQNGPTTTVHSVSQKTTGTLNLNNSNNTEKE